MSNRRLRLRILRNGPLIAALTLLAIGPAAAVAQDYNANYPQVGEDPGTHPDRALDNAVGEETIDPFTGQLKLVVNDLTIPSNGGLDLKVVRTYQSFAQVLAIPMRSYQVGRTATGVGWDLHFGRLWRGPAGNYLTPQLQATDTPNACNSITSLNSGHNPVLELPDGHRELFAAGDDVGKPYAYISPNHWILRCLPSSLDDAAHDGGAIVISPEGIKYTFNFYARVSSAEINPNGSQAQSNYAYHVTKIEHPNGTYITITYKPVTGANAAYYASLDTVTHSEGPVVTFSYDNITSMSAAHLHSFSQTLSASEGGTRTWTLNYVNAAVPADPSFENLHSVTRPDGRETSYDYWNAPSSGNYPDGVFSLKTITTPLKGQISYTYKQQLFPGRDGGSTNYWYVISQKTVYRLNSRPSSGVWTYSYTPAGTTGTQDSTTVIGPVTCNVYTHWSNQTTTGDTNWRVGLLVSKTTGNGGGTGCTAIRTETYTWVQLLVANQENFRPPVFIDTHTWAPRLSNVSITQDGGSAYTTTYNTPDAYGNPAQILESGFKPASFSSGTAAGTSRTIDVTYFTDPTTWIIHRTANETVESAGLTYATPTSSPVTSAHLVARTYYPTGTAKVGLLQDETVAGETTHYDYYTDTVQGGAASLMTDPNTFTTNFSSYKGGIPRTVSRSIDGTTTKTVTKTVGDSGMVLSTDDGIAANVTSYTYDFLNRLKSITTARTDDSNVTVTRSATPSITTDTITRGSYQEVRQYDGFGALTRTDWTDTNNLASPIYRTTDYDAEGRVKKAYEPNSTSLGDSYTYDGLGRVTQITHADNTFVSYAYQANGVTQITDERGFVTTQYFRGFGDPSRAELMRVQAERGDTHGPGPYQVTYLDRNLVGQVISINQENVIRTYKYNSHFQLFEEDHPEVGAVSYGLDAMGHVTSRSVGTSGITQYVLDRLYRLHLVQYPDATQNVDLEYFNNDLLNTATKAGSLWTYTYDPNHNLKTETLSLSTSNYPAAKTYGFTYEYDGMDGRSTIQYPTQLKISYVPDAFGRATAANATVSGATVTRFVSNAAYWPSGQLNTLTFPSGVTTTYGQDNRLRLSTFTSTVPLNGGVQTWVDRVYGYDNSSDVTSITDNKTGASSKSMTYDGLRRLRTASGGWGSGSVSYYSNDNINTKVFGSTSLTFNYGDSTNRLTSISGTTPLSFTYDVYGNETSTGRSSYGNFVFDDESLLKTVKNTAGTTQVSYLYDANRRMTLEQYPGNASTRYRVYGKNGLLLFEEDPANFYTIEYIYMGTRLVANRFLCTSNQDTDGDGMSDCQEARLGFNKNDPSDGTQDADGDGLTNAQEVALGTDPFNADTDGDGLGDQYEVSHGLNPLLADSNSDPDGDGLTNLQEAQKGTNPLKADTDGDGIPDNLDPNPTFNPAAFAAILQLLLGN